MRLIDSHVHFWRIGENGQVWPGPELTAIHRDFLEADFIAASAGHAVAGVVLVQSQPDPRDTEWLLSLAAESDLVLGVVGWADLEAEDAATRVERLARRPKLCGLRPMLQDMADDSWINRPALAPAFAAMEASGLVLDALVRPRHLPHLSRFSEAHPQLAIVVDHAAKPPVAEGRLEPWRSELEALAQHPNLFCKLSGLSSEAAADQPAAALRPYLEAVLSAFPPERLLWGSDWPVVDTRSEWSDWLSVCLGAVAERDRERVFFGTAASVYRVQ